MWESSDDLAAHARMFIEAELFAAKQGQKA